MRIASRRSKSWPRMTKTSDFKGRVQLHGFLRCDANVLYPAELRNLLMHLAMTGLFRARWSAGVHEEWITALLRNRPDLSREKLERTRKLMDKHAPDALVTGYEDLIEGLQLPDPGDRHVLAAAIRGRADVICHGERAGFSCGYSDALRNRGSAPG